MGTSFVFMYGIRYGTVRFDGGAVSIPPSLPQRASETLQPDSPSRGRSNRGSSPGGCGMRDGTPRILEVGEVISVFSQDWEKTVL
jgi:hypothetical protein